MLPVRAHIRRYRTNKATFHFSFMFDGGLVVDGLRGIVVDCVLRNLAQMSVDCSRS